MRVVRGIFGVIAFSISFALAIHSGNRQDVMLEESEEDHSLIRFSGRRYSKNKLSNGLEKHADELGQENLYLQSKLVQLVASQTLSNDKEDQVDPKEKDLSSLPPQLTSSNSTKSLNISSSSSSNNNSTSNTTQQVIHLKGTENRLVTNEDGEVYLIRVDPFTHATQVLNVNKIKEIDFTNAKVLASATPNDVSKAHLDDKYSLVSHEPFSWYLAIAEGQQPQRRGGHTLTAVGQTLLLFGGCFLDAECFNDVIFFNSITREWSSPKLLGDPPSPRGGHSATLVGQFLYIFGGSNEHGVLSDMHRLDLEMRVWEQFEYEGEKATGRTNHKGVLDNNGRIVIFGGYTNDGYSNEVFMLDLVNQRWVRPMVNGEAPLGRENFSMNLVRESYIWVFGGYALGGEVNDLWQLDVENMKWSRVFGSYGVKPTERQGHQMVIHGKLLYMIGGCNYAKEICYNDVYQLNIDDLTWTKLNFSQEKEVEGRDNYGVTLMGEQLYMFGGCELMRRCFDDLRVMNVTDACARNCNGRGVCRNNRCVCERGFQGEECEVRLMCEANCLNRGVCGSDGRCHCYQGYTGSICEIYVPCPANCTSEAAGRCEVDGKCVCNNGFRGTACENGERQGLPILEIECENKCSNHGSCNQETGVCICEVTKERSPDGSGCYGDIDCSLTETIREQRISHSSNDTLEIISDGNSTSVIVKDALNRTVTEAKKSLVGNQSISANSSSLHSNNTVMMAKRFPDSIGEQIIGFIHEQIAQTNNGGRGDSSTSFDRRSLIQNLSECPESCSFNGVCIDGECYCRQGVTGSECQALKVSQLSEGIKATKLWLLIPLFLIFGAIVGYFIIKHVQKLKEQKEFGDIIAYGDQYEEQVSSILKKDSQQTKQEIKPRFVEDGSDQDSFENSRHSLNQPLLNVEGEPRKSFVQHSEGTEQDESRLSQSGQEYGGGQAQPSRPSLFQRDTNSSVLSHDYEE